MMIQYVYWTKEWFHVSKVPWGICLSEPFPRTGDVLSWGSYIVKVNHMLNGKWPELRGDLAGPSTLGMQEHGSGSGANKTIVSFYDAILPMGIDSTERYRLILTCNISFIDIGIEDTIIHVDVVDLNPF